MAGWLGGWVAGDLGGEVKQGPGYGQVNSVDAALQNLAAFLLPFVFHQ